jgi:hypothetical protein
MSLLQKKLQIFYLIIIIIIGLSFRLYGLNWDQGHHLHPDERAIVMFTSPLHFPSTIEEFFSSDSPLNPNFFAYGSFPIYLLKLSSLIASQFDMSFAFYSHVNLVGRLLSVIFEIATIVLIFLIGKKIFSKKAGVLASFFYSISVLPIQISHFYIVDVPLTFFLLFILYQIICFYQNPTKKRALAIGVLLGFSLATKTSSLLIFTSIATALIADFFLIFIKNPHKAHVWFPHISPFLRKLLFQGSIMVFFAIIVFAILEPYAIIDFKEFYRQTLAQSQMTKDAFTFPYTLQYVGKIPYFYELKNIFLWGMGPILATVSFLGIIYGVILVIKKQKKEKWAQELILLIFFFTYFLIVGKFAVGWMRYMLPLYPIFCLFGGLLISQFLNTMVSKSPHRFLILNFKFLILLALLVWPLSFINIYSQSNTRAEASEWIYNNIPAGSTIAREHWDDGLPIERNANYNILELPIYEMENPSKKIDIYEKIDTADYIIIASNRLYAPLMRISRNCEKWNIPQYRCPHNANLYYERLFNGDLGFEKMAEFENYPTIPIFNISINDQSADESFTVYDHPKVMIFRKSYIL